MTCLIPQGGHKKNSRNNLLMILLIFCVENAIAIHETDEEDSHDAEEAADDQVSPQC